MKKVIVGLIILVCLLQYRLWVGEGSIGHVVRLNNKIDEQQVEVDQLKERNRQLAAEVESLKDGIDGIEERARSRMGMIKPDETFFMIVDENKRKP